MASPSQSQQMGLTNFHQFTFSEYGRQYQSFGILFKPIGISPEPSVEIEATKEWSLEKQGYMLLFCR